MVVADWGPIAREIAAQKKLEVEKASTVQASEPAAAPRGSAPAASQPLRPSIAVEVPGISIQVPRPDNALGLGLVQPSHLGGPKSTNDAVPEPEIALTDKGVFLRAAHRAACRVFGTVLGPEANSAHKNHFHVDMAERQHGVICE
jgi:hypothetical protein